MDNLESLSLEDKKLLRRKILSKILKTNNLMRNHCNNSMNMTPFTHHKRKLSPKDTLIMNAIHSKNNILQDTEIKYGPTLDWLNELLSRVNNSIEKSN